MVAVRLAAEDVALFPPFVALAPRQSALLLLQNCPIGIAAVCPPATAAQLPSPQICRWLPPGFVALECHHGAAFACSRCLSRRQFSQ